MKKIQRKWITWSRRISLKTLTNNIKKLIKTKKWFWDYGRWRGWFAKIWWKSKWEHKIECTKKEDVNYEDDCGYEYEEDVEEMEEEEIIPVK